MVMVRERCFPWFVPAVSLCHVPLLSRNSVPSEGCWAVLMENPGGVAAWTEPEVVPRGLCSVEGNSQTLRPSRADSLVGRRRGTLFVTFYLSH